MTDRALENSRADEQPERPMPADCRIDKVLSLLGHELRNPIAAISMGAEALAHMCAASRDQMAIVDVIRRQSLETSRLLENLLDLSRIHSGRLQLHVQRIDLMERLRQAMSDRAEKLAAQRIDLQFRPAQATPWLDADPDRLAHAFGELLDHLLALASPGDPLSIAATIAGDRGQIHVEIWHGAGGGNLSDASHIFEPFEARRSGRGLAVGLAIAKAVIELHGGAVEARGDAAEKVTFFRVILPLAGQGRDGIEPSETYTRQGNPRRILIIDDSPDVVTSLEFLLQQSGHQTFAAVDGRQGIETARKTKPDVVLCDIGLPGMDGYEVARQLRADPETAHIYLIAVSGYAGEEEDRRSREAGFDMHLDKPQGFVALTDLLQKAPISRRSGR